MVRLQSMIILINVTKTCTSYLKFQVCPEKLKASAGLLLESEALGLEFVVVLLPDVVDCNSTGSGGFLNTCLCMATCCVLVYVKGGRVAHKSFDKFKLITSKIQTLKKKKKDDQFAKLSIYYY